MDEFLVHYEYGRQSPIPYKYAVDLIYFPSVFDRRTFVFLKGTIGEIYEIEPINNAYNPGHGIDQAKRYTNILSSESSNLIGLVTDLNGTYNGWEYNWSSVNWEIGNTISSDIHSLDLVGGRDRRLMFWKQEPGLIVYVDTNQKSHVEEVMTNPKYKWMREEFLEAAPDNIIEEYCTTRGKVWRWIAHFFEERAKIFETCREYGICP